MSQEQLAFCAMKRQKMDDNLDESSQLSPVLIFTFQLALLVNHVLPCTIKIIQPLIRSCTLNTDLATSESEVTKEEKVSKSNCYLLL